MTTRHQSNPFYANNVISTYDAEVKCLTVKVEPSDSVEMSQSTEMLQRGRDVISSAEKTRAPNAGQSWVLTARKRTENSLKLSAPVERQLHASARIKMTTSPTSSIDQEFQEWKLKYNKVYPTPEEEARRKVLWLACREMVLAHNKLADEGVHTWWMEVNMFADLDKENGETPCGCMRPRNQDNKCGNTDDVTEDGC